MEAMGIPDEEDIIKKKKEKDNLLKDKFNIESFEQKYDRELKKRAEKKKKLEEDKYLREREAYTFQPDLQNNRTPTRASQSKSPVMMGSRGMAPNSNFS
jgi:hypothetical protein